MPGVSGKESTFSRWRLAVRLGISLAIVTLVAMRLWVIEFHLIASNSMANTLLPGDVVLVNRVAGGLVSIPERNQIWVFGPHSRVGDALVKRIVGIPGDTVLMRDGAVYVNGVELEEPYVRARHGKDSTTRNFTWQQQFLASDAAASSYSPTLWSWGPLAVPEDSFLVLGDNRVASIDSRHLGFVGADRMIGRVEWLFFSYGGPAPGGIVQDKGVRWKRLGRID